MKVTNRDKENMPDMMTDKGMDFDTLPNDVKNKIFHSSLGAGQSWVVLTKGIGNITPEQELKARRILKNLSQSDLAKLAGIRQADVSKIEKNHKKVSIEVLEKYVHGLDLSLKDILAKDN